MGWYYIQPFTITLNTLTGINIGGSTNEITVLDISNTYNKNMNLIINARLTSISGAGGTQTTRVYKGNSVIKSQSYTGNDFVEIWQKMVYNIAPGVNVKISFQSTATTITGVVEVQYIWIDPDQLVLYSVVDNVEGNQSLESYFGMENTGTYEHRYKVIFTPESRVYRLDWVYNPWRFQYNSIKVNGVLFRNGIAPMTFNNYYVDGILRSEGGVFTAMSGVKIYQIN